MFLVKGLDAQYEKFYKIMFSSVNMEEEKLLYLFLRHSDSLLLLSNGIFIVLIVDLVLFILSKLYFMQEYNSLPSKLLLK